VLGTREDFLRYRGKKDLQKEDQHAGVRGAASEAAKERFLSEKIVEE